MDIEFYKSFFTLVGFLFVLVSMIPMAFELVKHIIKSFYDQKEFVEIIKDRIH